MIRLIQQKLWNDGRCFQSFETERLSPLLTWIFLNE